MIAAQIEQIVDQAGQLADLALEHAERRATLSASPPPMRKTLHGVADRGQRVAQLVRQHGQELVLAAVGFRQIGGQAAQAVLQLSALGDVLADRGECHRLSVGVGQRRTL